MNKSIHHRGLLAPMPLGRGYSTRPWLAIAIALSLRSAAGQDAVRNSLLAAPTTEPERLQLDALPYTVKSGDFRLLLVPSMGVEWNDNVFLTKTNAKADVILRPKLNASATYPLTERNLLSVQVGAGYDKYLDQDVLSTWFVESGSQVGLDIDVKDVRLNVHDRFEYVRDGATEAGVAGTGRYGNADNMAGLLATWSLKDTALSLGYDHENVFAQSAEFNFQDRATEIVLARAGFRVYPEVVVGPEATAAFTAYDQPVLNNNAAYSVGAYADWAAGTYLRVQPRAGYVTYQFQHTSHTVQTKDLNSWYADLLIAYDITDTVSLSLDGGHELRIGVESDAMDDYFVRPGVTWAAMKNVDLQSSLSYEHGKQGAGNVSGNLTETYDWFTGSIGIRVSPIKRLTTGLDYRFTLRSSSQVPRGYDQNLIQLVVSYQLP